MHTERALHKIPIWGFQLGGFLFASLVQIIFWSQIGWGGDWPLPLILAAGLVSLLAAAVTGLVVRIWREQIALKDRLGATEEQLQTWKTLLGGTRQMDLRLQDATNEEQVMDTALGLISSLSGARGVSFVPLDDWGQPLPAYTYGKLPAPVARAWNEHLLSSGVRDMCRDCQRHAAETGDECPLHGGPFGDVLGLACFPVQRGGRMLGMVNLYMAGKPAPSEELTGYLRGLVNEAALSVESIRLRNRELETLRQVQALRPVKSDLQALLAMLLEGMQQVLGVAAVQLQSRAADRAHQPPVLLELGRSDLLIQPDAARAREWVIANRTPYLPPAGQPGNFACVALARPGGNLEGTLLLAAETPLALDERSLTILSSVADQAALLIENEREMLSLEYRTVIQERARLAREIHDGLAQTLAFLKLQSAQMQLYLNQGNLNRLAQVMKENYDELARAYLETRQAIDNLRLAPRQGLTTWLDQLLDDFQHNSGLPVERVFSQVTRDVSPEVQAQMVRIVQEALSNIRKHAAATQVTVQLREWNGDMVLEVRDNGVGFVVADVPGVYKYGLRGMQERAELIGADFQVISKKQQGTTVRLSVPLRA